LETRCGCWYGHVLAHPLLPCIHCIHRHTQMCSRQRPCFVSQRSTAHNGTAAEDVCRTDTHTHTRHRASPHPHMAQEDQPVSLSYAFHGILRHRLTFCCTPHRRTLLLIGPRGSRPSSLLPPRSALLAAPHMHTHVLLRGQHTPLLCQTAWAESGAHYSTIDFRPAWIRWVRCNTLLSRCQLLWPPPHCPNPHTSFHHCVHIRPIIHPQSSSPFACAAYQHRPTGHHKHRALRTASAHSTFGVRETCLAQHAIHSSTAPAYQAPAVLRDISGGTSYQAVRLVFRPYTQVAPSNCTSEQIRTSTGVSPGFILPRHSSLPTGSHTHSSQAFAAPNRFHLLNSLRICTPWSVFQDGACKQASSIALSPNHISMQSPPLAILLHYRSFLLFCIGCPQPPVHPALQSSTTHSARNGHRLRGSTLSSIKTTSAVRPKHNLPQGTHPRQQLPHVLLPFHSPLLRESQLVSSLSPY